MGVNCCDMPLPQIHTFANGLTLAVEEQPWNPGVAMQFLVSAGAMTDPDGLEGASNLIEGWLWKGTQNYDARGLAEAFDDLGVRKGSSAGLEYTTFASQFLADKLEQVLKLYGEVLMRPTFPQDGLEPLKQIALQELASLEDQPPKKMFSILRREVFLSPHGRSAAGTKDHISSATPEALRQDFKNRYGAKGAVLAFVGGVDFESAKRVVGEIFGEWQEGVAVAPEIILSDSKKILVEHDSAQSQIGMIYPDVTYSHPEFYTSRLVAQILSGGMGSRLFTEVRQKRGLVYSVYASPNALKGYHYLTAYAGTTPERSDTTLSVMMGEIERIAEGVTEEELSRASTGLRTSLIMAEESARSRVGSLTRDLYMLGRVRTLEEIQNEFAQIDLARVNKFLSENSYRNPWICILGKKMEAAQ